MAPERKNYHSLDTDRGTRGHSRVSKITAVVAAVAGAACATQSRGGEEAPEKPGSDTVYVQVQPDTYQAPPGPDTLPPGPDTVQAPEPDTVSPDTITPENDFDGDGIVNSKDPCMYTADFKDQAGNPINIDGDSMPDACDGCKTVSDDGTDSDNDGVPDACDNSPGYNPSQADSDFDGIGDKTDNAPNCFNPEQVDNDGDGSPAACGDCNDNDADFNPGALDEPCDQVDKDCDGNAEDADIGCACTIGATQSVPGTCADGEKTCQLTGAETSGWVTTTEADNGTAEICGNNVDEDCSTVADDAPECVNQCEPGAVQDCGETKGECGKQLGTSTCDSKGAWGACAGDTKPTAEVCDGADNDCDDATDEDFGVGESCTAKGACGKVEGHKECMGTNATMCDTAPGGSKDASVSETCNGEDDDCDGEVDNAVFSVVGGEEGTTAKVGTACKGVGECKDGTNKCEDTLAVKCSAFDKAAPTDACDQAGKDENCDGVSNPGCECDDGDQAKSCQTQANVCVKGEQTCDDDKWSDCNGEVLGTPETCDGADNNCDGKVDNLPNGTVGAGCEGKMGVCADVSGQFECDANGGVVCTSEYAATQEVCGNKLDDDCDGLKDEGPFTVKGGKPGELANPGEACETGVGECKGSGVFECASDFAVVCDNGKTPGTELPDAQGKDEDCDGASNEGFDCKDGDKPKSCQSQPVVCEPGKQTCVGGEWSGCVGEQLGSVEVCNGADDDCNGTADDKFNVGGGCTGKGECGDGVVQCNPNDPNGTMCSTMPGGKDDQSGKEVCDGLDNDCNGIKDDLTDGTVGKACPGTGVCADGTLECEGGKLQCSTMEGGNQYVGTKEVCDGADNDCDGETDEGVWAGKGAVGLPCPAGVGACEGEGYTVCATDQSTKCSNEDNASLEKADKIDNDCDSSVDEGFDCVAGETQPCGGDFEVGICKFGTQTCGVDNKWDECGGKFVGPVPELCNSIDDDCNGKPDNGFDVGKACLGKGECAETPGVLECDSDDPSSKKLICSTGPEGSSSQVSDEVCDGKDNNCNGKTDEGIGTLGLPGDKCTNPGVCGEGTVACDGLSATKCKTAVMPGDLKEKCDGKDNDCDGAVDEGFKTGETCTDKCGDVGVYVCKTENPDESECSAKDPKEVPGNGVDDDCDGATDEEEK